MCVWELAFDTARAVYHVLRWTLRFTDHSASESSPAVQHHGRGGATPYVRKHGTAHRGTVLEFGDRRLALSFEMDGADASLIVKTCEIPCRDSQQVCVCGLGKTEESEHAVAMMTRGWTSESTTLQNIATTC